MKRLRGRLVSKAAKAAAVVALNRAREAKNEGAEARQRIDALAKRLAAEAKEQAKTDAKALADIRADVDGVRAAFAEADKAAEESATANLADAIKTAADADAKLARNLSELGKQHAEAKTAARAGINEARAAIKQARAELSREVENLARDIAGKADEDHTHNDIIDAINALQRAARAYADADHAHDEYATKKALAAAVSKLERIRAVPGPKGDKPRHRWRGTVLEFEGPDGKFRKGVDLLGPQGARGRAGTGNTEPPAADRQEVFIGTPAAPTYPALAFEPRIIDGQTVYTMKVNAP